MRLKLNDKVVLRSGKIVTITERTTASIFQATHQERDGESLGYYRLEDVIAFAGQMDSRTTPYFPADEEKGGR